MWNQPGLSHCRADKDKGRRQPLALETPASSLAQDHRPPQMKLTSLNPAHDSRYTLPNPTIATKGKRKPAEYFKSIHWAATVC